MGREYKGDIEGKMWVTVQPSNDADNFGVIGEPFEPSGDLHYHFTEDNEDDINEELARCMEAIGKDNLEIMDRYYKEHRTESHQDVDDLKSKIGDTEYKKLEEYYARIELGEKILECIMDNDTCSFSVEC